MELNKIYYNKYLKYKNKYLKYKNKYLQQGGSYETSDKSLESFKNLINSILVEKNFSPEDIEHIFYHLSNNLDCDLICLIKSIIDKLINKEEMYNTNESLNLKYVNIKEKTQTCEIPYDDIFKYKSFLNKKDDITLKKKFLEEISNKTFEINIYILITDYKYLRHYKLFILYIIYIIYFNIILKLANGDYIDDDQLTLLLIDDSLIWPYDKINEPLEFYYKYKKPSDRLAYFRKICEVYHQTFYNTQKYTISEEQKNNFKSELENIKDEIDQSMCKLIKAIIDNIKIISFHEFIFNLIKSFILFQQKINYKEYILLIIYDIGINIKSNTWIPLLLLDILINNDNNNSYLTYNSIKLDISNLQLPFDMIFIPNNHFSNIIDLVKKLDKPMILCDDAVYTGQQLSQNIKPYICDNLHICTSYNSDTGLAKLINVRLPKDKIFYGELINTIDKIIPQDYIDYKKENDTKQFEINNCFHPYCSLTIFEHKLADDTSTVENLIYGRVVVKGKIIQLLETENKMLIKECIPDDADICMKAFYKKSMSLIKFNTNYISIIDI